MNIITTNRLFSTFFLCIIFTSFGANLPKGGILYEAEDFFMKDRRFEIREDIHSSATKFVGNVPNAVASKEECILFQSDFPSVAETYTIWACVRGIELELRSAILNGKRINSRGKEWHWISLGRYTAKEIGSTFSIYGVPGTDGLFGESGLDAVVLSPDNNFVPQGVFNGYAGREEQAADSQTVASAETIEVKINTLNTGSQISEFIASANAHGAAGHTPDNLDWDATMQVFYSGNLLALLTNANSKAKPGEPAWDFAAIDKFAERAKQRWQVSTLMFFPQWWLKFDGTTTPTPAQLDAGIEVLMQAVRRYGSKDSLHYMKYWVICDEWPGTSYWKKNYQEFARYYARMVREVKKFNPELVVGGPVDCWPNDTIIAELLKTCPELDFIAWNMFITGRADTSLKTLFKRTGYIRTCLRSSRELGQRYRQKDVPVMITSLGPNYHAWDPLDLQMAKPVYGVWHALALNYMIEENCAGGLFYNIRARDCGFFGPCDAIAAKAKMQPADIAPEMVNLRPSGRVVQFYKSNFAGKFRLPVSVESKADDFSAIAATDRKGELAIALVNFAEIPRLVKICLEPFEMVSYGGFRLPSRFIYCDRSTVTSGEGFFFNADGYAELWMPPYSSWCIVTENRRTPTADAAKLAQAVRYQDAAAVFHFDGNLNDVAESGSKSLGWYGEHLTSEMKKCGTGAENFTGDLHNRAKIQLKGKAIINDSKMFGIAFWVYRVKNRADFGSILSFGNGKFMIEHVGGGNPDERFQVKNAGFCKFGGTWNHSLMIPKEQWTHVAITADGQNGRIIVNGKTMWTFSQENVGLNGSDILYLGSQKNDDGPIDCYMDELIISDKASGEKWAADIYEKTRNGQNY